MRLGGVASMLAVVSTLSTSAHVGLHHTARGTGPAAATDPCEIVWPLPQRCVAPGDGPLQLDGNFTIHYSGTSARLGRAVRRYSAILGYAVTNKSVAGPIKALELTVDADDGQDGYPGWTTNASYTVTVDASGKATASAGSIYGAMYAMETFAQMLGSSGQLNASSVQVKDWPDRAYRGLMLDIGRRFFPPSLIRAYLDAMSCAKMSVLHMHLTDEFRWSVESHAFPALTADLEPGEFYTQAELKALIEYGADRGIRLVPEIDLPAHASPCMQQLDVAWCSDTTTLPAHNACSTSFGTPCPDKTQLYAPPPPRSHRSHLGQFS
jgi:hypothetical protein